MGVLTPWLSLLDLIEQQKYIDAVLLLEDGKLEKSQISELIPTLLLRVGNCFGRDENEELGKLMQILLRFGTAQERSSISQQLLLDGPRSLQLWKLLMANLVVDFDDLSEKLQNELRTQLPAALEDLLLKYLEENEEEIMDVVRLSAHLFTLTHYMKSKFGFSLLLDTVIRTVDLTHSAMGPILVQLAQTRPFHPVVFMAMAKSPAELSLIPSVFSASLLKYSLTSECVSYLSVYNGNRLMVDVVHNALQTIEKLNGEKGIPAEKASLFVELFLGLLKIVQDIDLGSVRVEIMKQFVSLLDRFEDVQRVLILKRIIHLIVNQSINLTGEAQILAWMIDLYRKKMHLKVYKDELGTVWNLLAKLRYDDPVEATAYYISLFCLAQHQAMSKWNVELMRVVDREILQSIHKQISDYITLQRTKERKEDGTDDIDFRNMNFIITSMEMTEQYVKEFIL